MRLYKYFHPDRADILKNGNIRFSPPKALNDPFELKPYISEIQTRKESESDFQSLAPEMITKIYEELPADVQSKLSLEQIQALAMNQSSTILDKLQETFEQARPRVQKSMESTFDEVLGILCLTESPDNLLMWAHYADSHQGFVVEFDTDNSFFDQRLHSDDDFRCLRKVCYSTERPNIVISKLDDFKSFLTKGLEWSYETEWRMMLHLENASTVLDDGSTAVHLFNFPKSSIRRVILGCRVSDAKAAEIRQILKDSREYANVVCQQAQIDASKYALNFFT